MPDLCGTQFVKPNTVNNVPTLAAYLKNTLSAHWISDWNQSGRNDVGTGVCMGMCLDWIRRILTGLSSGNLTQAKSAIAPSFGFVNKRTKVRWEEMKTAHRLYKTAQVDVMSRKFFDLKIRSLRAQLIRVSVLLDPNNPPQGHDLTTLEGLGVAYKDIASRPSAPPNLANDFETFVTHIRRIDI